jgi:hypothetical protein
MHGINMNSLLETGLLSLRKYIIQRFLFFENKLQVLFFKVNE